MTVKFRTKLIINELQGLRLGRQAMSNIKWNKFIIKRYLRAPDSYLFLKLFGLYVAAQKVTQHS